MAGKSSQEHRRPEVIECFESGLSVGQTAKKFEGIIGKGTIYRWHEKWLLGVESLGRPNNVDDPDMAKAVEVEVLNGTNNITTIQGYAQTSDFNKARHTLRKICDDKNEPGAVRVAAARSLLETVKIRAQISQNILDEVAEVKIKNEVDALSTLSKEELMERLRNELAS